MYANTVWYDHVVERPNTYTSTPNSDGSYTYEAAPGEIIQQGTPMSATHFNNLEQGTLAANGMADLLYSYILLKIGHGVKTLDELEEWIETVETDYLAPYLIAAQHSIQQAIDRDQIERIVTIETQLAALTS